MKFINSIFKSSIFLNSKRFIYFEAPVRGIPRKPPKNLKEYLKNALESQKYLPKHLKSSYETHKADVKEKLSTDTFINHLSYKYFAKFREMSDEELKSWPISTDSVEQGRSTASLVKHPERGTAIFSGYLDTTVPPTGDIVRSGLVNFRSPHKMILGSVRSITFYPYNYFIIKYRGDGRTYSLNIHMNHYIDAMWHDQFISPLYTRGGPYWQIAKIPFHKFFLTSRGRIQDIQGPLIAKAVRHVSISLMDQTQGEFHFEVDYMGLQKELFYNEEFSYESYNMPNRSHRFK